MKKIILLILLLILILSSVAFLLTRMDKSAGPGLSLTLASITELALLESSEFYYQIIFPFDFLPDQKTIQLIDQGYLSEDILSEDQREAHTLAKEVGLHNAWKTSFVIFSVLIRAGIGLDDSPIEIIPSEILTLRLPPPQITSVEVVDMATDYPFPPIALDAEQWKRVSAFIERQSLKQAKEDGILSHAQKSLEESLEGILNIAGMGPVTFSQHDN